MSDIRNIKLELLRPGPAHNQLLSPLTPYLALCGADGPVTVSMPFEHRQLLSRLERLRYFSDGREIAPGQREAEVREMGEAMGRVLAQIPGLVAELGAMRSDTGSLVHLRLSMSAFELALVPFELAIGTDGFPGSGSPMFVQANPPITLTREVRRGRPLPVHWNRKPRILFAFASPDGLSPVPATAHLEALRRVIAPWTKWKADAEQQITEVKQHLTVLPNASLQKIRRECASADYTHVHVLAHGAPVGRDGDRHYGVALCSDTDTTAPDVVDGDALATALTARDSRGNARIPPTVVTLATCDSGHAGSVITPGGSIAHALHAGGIPWVIASQFPLWKHASVVAVEELYTGLLRGEDPRLVLHTLRGQLRTEFTHTHDWAAIVAYAVVPWNFEREVEAFRNLQMRRAIDVKFDKADELVKRNEDVTALHAAIRADLTQWCESLPATATPRDRSERLGMTAASEKKIGDLFSRRGQDKQARDAYERARGFYEEALRADPVDHWAITQYLSMHAVLGAGHNDGRLLQDYGSWWAAVRQIAKWDLRRARGENRAWALGTLAELELLGVIYGGPTFDVTAAKTTIEGLCRDLRDAAGGPFPVFSTWRQFTRYGTVWAGRPWDDLAKAAVTALGVDEPVTGPTHPGRST